MRLSNTLTRRTDELALREPGKASLYRCGPQVHGPPHVGHVRAWIRLAPPAEPTEEAAAVQRFRAAMDDLGTPAAHAVLFNLVAAGNTHVEAGRDADAAALRAVFSELSGVLGDDLAERRANDALVAPLVEELLALRSQASERKTFATADGIRARLGGLGVVVTDSPDGPRWYLGILHVAPRAGRR